MSRRRPEIPIASLHGFRGGTLLGADDATILSAACEEDFTLVTYDRRTVWPPLQRLAEQGIPHAGAVFVNPEEYASHDIGGLIRALAALWDAYGNLD